ncbi:unnamed protein product [Cunninghamella echinulata]
MSGVWLRPFHGYLKPVEKPKKKPEAKKEAVITANSLYHIYYCSYYGPSCIECRQASS